MPFALFNNHFLIFFSSWKKCKAKLSTLTNTSGDHRPGQSGTTGDNEKKSGIFS